METDPEFFDRADAHIHLSNEQIGDVTRGKVSASMMYATARFNAWVSACGFASGPEMAAARKETVDYFVIAHWPTWARTPAIRSRTATTSRSRRRGIAHRPPLSESRRA